MSAPSESSFAFKSVEARCLRLNDKAADAASVSPVVERLALSRTARQVLIEVRAAAVNPSDVKAATGLMPYAVFPRTPGRDYAGVVIDGPDDWVGCEVFGSSGDLGIRRDGTHGTHLSVEADAVVKKPRDISFEEAAGIGVPFVTAMEGLRRAGLPKPGEWVLVMGVNGKVGQAGQRAAGEKDGSEGHVIVPSLRRCAHAAAAGRPAPRTTSGSPRGGRPRRRSGRRAP